MRIVLIPAWSAAKRSRSVRARAMRGFTDYIDDYEEAGLAPSSLP